MFAANNYVECQFRILVSIIYANTSNRPGECHCDIDQFRFQSNSIDVRNGNEMSFAIRNQASIKEKSVCFERLKRCVDGGSSFIFGI